MNETVLLTLLTIITAATPLVYASIGELVVERSGVLNLGVEGMILVGAVSSFAVFPDRSTFGWNRIWWLARNTYPFSK